MTIRPAAHHQRRILHPLPILHMLRIRRIRPTRLIRHGRASAISAFQRCHAAAASTFMLKQQLACAVTELVKFQQQQLDYSSGVFAPPQ